MEKLSGKYISASVSLASTREAKAPHLLQWKTQEKLILFTCFVLPPRNGVKNKELTEVTWTEIKNGDSSFLISFFLLTILQSQPLGAEGHLLCSSDISALTFALENGEPFYGHHGRLILLGLLQPFSSFVFLKTCTSFSSGGHICFHHQSLPLRTWWSSGLDQLQGDLFPFRAPSLLLLFSTALLFSLSFCSFP